MACTRCTAYVPDAHPSFVIQNDSVFQTALEVSLPNFSYTSARDYVNLFVT